MKNDNWGAEAWRKPSIEAGDKILFSEYGRVLNNIDYRSHWFLIVKDEYARVYIVVKHGGGQERVSEYGLGKIVDGLEVLNSDQRYMMIYALYDMHKKGKRGGNESTKDTYINAFVSGKLRKRALPKQGKIKVWIEQ